MAVNSWWDADPSEIYWMEIRHDASGMGEYLRAPRAAGDGNPSWSYELTSFVRPGDRVLHWHQTPFGEPGIVGWSEAIGPLSIVDWSWQARGTRGRLRGQPIEGPAWNMPLAGFVETNRPILRSEINAHRPEVLAVLQEIGRTHRRPTYAPFQNYGNRELRAQQGYLTKFPAALIDLLFAEPGVSMSSRAEVRPTPSARRARGQGYLADADMRSALERRALDVAISHYQAAGADDIEERGKPYDLRVLLDGVERHVEVKGSLGRDLESVQLTQGEVDHARNFQPTDLFVVDGIIAVRGDDGVVRTAGGEARLWSDWNPEDRSLRPTHLRYTLPH